MKILGAATIVLTISYFGFSRRLFGNPKWFFWYSLVYLIYLTPLTLASPCGSPCVSPCVGVERPKPGTAPGRPGNGVLSGGTPPRPPPVRLEGGISPGLKNEGISWPSRA